MYRNIARMAGSTGARFPAPSPVLFECSHTALKESATNRTKRSRLLRNEVWNVTCQCQQSVYLQEFCVLPGWMAQLVKLVLWTKRLPVLLLVKAHTEIVGSVRVRAHTEGNHFLFHVDISLSLSLLSSL